MPDLTHADPTAVLLGWLRAHPSVTGPFGTSVNGTVEAPWPHLRVFPGVGGELGDLQWRMNLEVGLEVYGDPEGRIGSASLRTLLITVLMAARELEDVDHTDPRRPVVTRVTLGSPPTPQPLTSGQTRWGSSVYLNLHPPLL